MSFDRLWDQIGHDLGWHDHSMRRDRPYNGQSHTDTGIRGAMELKGVTFRDLRDCYIRAWILAHDHYKDGTIETLQPNAALRDEAYKGEGAALCESEREGLSRRSLERRDPLANLSQAGVGQGKREQHHQDRLVRRCARKHVGQGRKQAHPCLPWSSPTNE